MITASRLSLGLVLASVIGMPFSTAAAAFVPSSIMDVTAINAVGDGKNPGDGGLISFQTDGVGLGGVVTPAGLIGVSLTGFTDDNQVTAITQEGLASVPSPNRSLVEDFNVDTALANYTTMELTFDSAVVNRQGIDVFVIDIGRDTDSFSATINGVTKTYAQNEAKSSNLDERDFAVWSSNQLPGNFSTVAELDAATFTLANGDANSGRRVTLVDLSDFGLADGDSATSIQLASSSGHDVAFVAGLGMVIPEPTSSAMFCLLTTMGIACGRGARK